MRLGNPEASPTPHPQGADSLVVVSDAIHLVGEVHGEGDAVQTLVANDAPEAARVIGLPHSLQDLAHGVGR